MIEKEEQNKKIYSKLLSIFQNESRTCSKSRGAIGPISLNISARMQKVSQISKENQQLSDRLSNIKCEVP